MGHAGPISAQTIQTNAKVFCPAEFINALLEKIHPWHSVSIKAVTPWSVQFTLGSHRANFYASSESDGRIKVFSTWGSEMSMECLSQYTDQMNGFAKHINGILEGKIRDDEGKLVEVLLHDKPQADRSVGVALNHGYPPILARMDKDGDIQYWDLEGGVLYDSRFQPVDPSLYAYVLYGTGNKYFDGKSCEALNYSKADGKCQVRVGESITWVDSSMLWKPGQDPTVKESLPVHHSPGFTKMVDHSVGVNKLVPPVGYRLLHESAKVDPRKAGDWYWSLKLRKWIALREDVVEYANRDDWAACRLGQSDSVVKENLIAEKWKPKIGDWVRIKKPHADPYPVDWPVWTNCMNKYDDQIVRVKEIYVVNSYECNVIVHNTVCFHFDWLEPAEAPSIEGLGK